MKGNIYYRELIHAFLFQDIPVSKYLLTTVAQLVMASGQLEKLEKTGNTLH